MKIGLFTSGYQEMDLEQAFQDAQSFGYDYIELWGGFPHAYPEDMDAVRIAEIRQLSQKYHIPIRVYTPELNAYAHNLALADERQEKRIFQYLCRSITIAKELEAPYVLISFAKGRGDLSKKKSDLFLLQKLIEYAKEQKIIVLLESLTPKESNLCCRIADLQDFLGAISSPYLQTMCDVVAAHASQESLVEYCQHFQEKMAHVHFVDSDGVSEDHLMLNTGILPLAKMFHFLKASSFDGGVTIEFVSKYIDRPSWSFAEAMNRIKEYSDA